MNDSHQVTDAQTSEQRVRAAHPNAECIPNPYKNHSEGINFAIRYNGWMALSSWVESEKKAWDEATLHSTVQAYEAQHCPKAVAPTEQPHGDDCWCSVCMDEARIAVRERRKAAWQERLHPNPVAHREGGDKGPVDHCYCVPDRSKCAFCLLTDTPKPVAPDSGKGFDAKFHACMEIGKMLDMLLPEGYQLKKGQADAVHACARKLAEDLLSGNYVIDAALASRSAPPKDSFCSACGGRDLGVRCSVCGSDSRPDPEGAKVEWRADRVTVSGIYPRERNSEQDARHVFDCELLDDDAQEMRLVKITTTEEVVETRKKSA